MKVTTEDISKLRKMTGAGMMDCKNALVEAEGNIEKAIEVIRKRGQAIANKRADRDAGEGVVLARTSADHTYVAMIVLNCETDFVAKNETFVGIANTILDLAIEKRPANLDALKNLQIKGKTVIDTISESIAAIGEKVDLSYFESISAEFTIPYIHAGSKLATMIGFNKKIADIQVAKDIAMQAAAMNPVAIDKENVSQAIIDKELEIGKEQARQEGKPEAMLDKIALGKLNKFFSESTLVNQSFIKDSKITVRQYLNDYDKELKVIDFKRFSLTI
ncbi:MAG: translation elongation factor Ts [Bacteroidetes bacterium GWF2_33_38]|nr:MAG: translation elongation factor Ts [Bacteroidetes bacterium GWF2_33_38]OFY74214.1 MAG: translation elongation factor Ts [Bacteroidetes bacterium RIFOXYA12_FULL_33_9]OFY92374.1 MAG: translation elongation factor Ts [Bacteroidetes bacterium RIFOXYA2_FULL_33_7]HBX50629.1 elongation factor Ts [Bacteroidales bacterium]